MVVYILLSGGIDSMACIKYYSDLNYEVHCIFCNYGQLALLPEHDAAITIASYFNVPIHEITTLGCKIVDEGEIFGRNALFIMQALLFAGKGDYKIVLGIHDGTGYSDCSRRFVKEINRVLDCYSSGTVILEAPFVDWRKGDIIRFCQANNLPLEITYSCEKGTIPPCGECLSCLDRKEFSLL